MLNDKRLRHLVAANALISMAGYAAIAWAPVYFQRIHGFSTGESGTFLAITIGVGGGIGTFLGGYYADRISKFGEGWRAWIVCITTLIYVPTGYFCYTSTDPTLAGFWFIGPGALGGVYLGINAAILQTLMPLEIRAVGAAINLFCLNIIGLGLGLLSVGMISDLANPTHGQDALRLGLLFTLIIMTWGAIHQLRVGALLNQRQMAT